MLSFSVTPLDIKLCIDRLAPRDRILSMETVEEASYALSRRRKHSEITYVLGLTLTLSTSSPSIATPRLSTACRYHRRDPADGPDAMDRLPAARSAARDA